MADGAEKGAHGGAHPGPDRHGDDTPFDEAPAAEAAPLVLSISGGRQRRGNDTDAGANQGAGDDWARTAEPGSGRDHGRCGGFTNLCRRARRIQQARGRDDERYQVLTR